MSQRAQPYPVKMLMCIRLRLCGGMMIQPETKTGLIHTSGDEKIGPKHHTNSLKLV